MRDIFDAAAFAAVILDASGEQTVNATLKSYCGALPGWDDAVERARSRTG